MRRVDLAHVLIKIIGSDQRSYHLLLRHAKWGDLSLVGGHVEPDETEMWAAAARRETAEELPSLKPRDFLLVPLLRGPTTWGPRASRSAGGEPTIYRAQVFRLVFRSEPAPILAALDPKSFALVPEDDLLADAEVGDLVRQLVGALRGGLQTLPAAWDTPLQPSVLAPLRRRAPALA